MKKLIVALSVLVTSQAISADFVELSRVGDLSFGRNAISGQLEIYQSGQPVEVPIDARINYYPQGAFEFGGKPYLLVYDVAANVPSGRRLSRGAEENDLYVVTVNGGVASFERVATMPVGIDIKMQVSKDGAGILVCATTACLRIQEGWFSTSYSQISVPAGNEIVELAGSYVMLQHGWNDLSAGIPPAEESIFSVCSVHDEVTECEAVPADTIPFRLKSDGSFERAEDSEELLRFDYDRLGIANYAETNLEARIAWSNVYFLSGLSALYQMQISDEFKSEIKARLSRELDAIIRLGETSYPGFAARRYSMDREPVTFLLHLSRIAKTVERARSVVGDQLADRLLDRILPQILAPETTVEFISSTPRLEVQYRKYMPFWADGVNVPWNYQNGWIEAVSLTTPPEPLRPLIASLIQTFFTEERISERPDKWSYAGGVFNEGWTDGRSSNTPQWSGQKTSNSPAHISYRSMDALALLAAKRAGIEVPDGFSAYASDLVSRGLLYPFVNEGLDAPATIPFHVARHYARSWHPWHFQNQVWAIGKLP